MGIFFFHFFIAHVNTWGGAPYNGKNCVRFPSANITLARRRTAAPGGEEETDSWKVLQFSLIDDDDDDVFVPRLAMSVSIFTFFSANVQIKKPIPTIAAVVTSPNVFRADVHAYRVFPFARRVFGDFDSCEISSTIHTYCARSGPCVTFRYIRFARVRRVTWPPVTIRRLLSTRRPNSLSPNAMFEKPSFRLHCTAKRIYCEYSASTNRNFLSRRVRTVSVFRWLEFSTRSKSPVHVEISRQ